ncbi:MAG: hypothetical protein ACR2QA_14495 [Solirubrobacteraceae bacterium]
MRLAALAALAAVALELTGCGAGLHQRPLRLPPDERPIPIGRGPGFRLAGISPSVRRREPVAGLRCTTSHPDHYGVHLELFAHRPVLLIPAGIGIASLQRKRGADVIAGACSYPLSTIDPTGIIVVDPGPVRTLRMLSALWGQPLSQDRLAGFRGPVEAFVDGRPLRGPAGDIPLRRHAEIVIEVGDGVLPHPAYRFPPGLGCAGEPPGPMSEADNLPLDAMGTRADRGCAEAAKRAGLPIKVALIDTVPDLGVLTQLFGKPQRYADFLDQEISYPPTQPQPLLVVMPGGFGVRGVDSAAKLGLGSVPAPVGAQSDDLARAAIAAVAKLAAASGHPIKSASGTGSASSPADEGRASTTVILAVLVLAALAMATALLIVSRRRRQA